MGLCRCATCTCPRSTMQGGAAEVVGSLIHLNSPSCHIFTWGIMVSCCDWMRGRMRKTKEIRSSRIRPIKAIFPVLAGAKSVEVTIEVLAKSKEILDYMVDEAGDLGLLDARLVMVLVSMRHEYCTGLHREVCSYITEETCEQRLAKP